MSERIKAHVRMIDDAREELGISANILEECDESILDDEYFKECKKEFISACLSFSQCIENAPRAYRVEP